MRLVSSFLTVQGSLTSVRGAWIGQARFHALQISVEPFVAYHGGFPKKKRARCVKCSISWCFGTKFFFGERMLFCHCGRIAHPNPSSMGGEPTMLQATSRNRRTEHKEPRCAALQLARRIPPALPTTHETLVDEAEGRKTIKKIRCPRVHDPKNWQFSSDSFEFWAQGCMCLRIQVSGI